MNLVVLPPHFEPDTAPTGVIWTRIVTELALRGHRIEVITSLPWYREHKVEAPYEGKIVRHEDRPWGRITRIHPFPTADKKNIFKRALSFGGFSALTAVFGARGMRADAVIAISPPMTLALSGWAIAKARRAALILNLQDIFPDVAIELGAFKRPATIEAARRLERICYRASDAITVLSDDLRDNVTSKGFADREVRVIPNFVETDRIVPGPKENPYRDEFGLNGRRVVMYAGNVGLSQSLGIVLDAAAALAYEEDVVFVINGGGARRDEIEKRARGMSNVRLVDMQPAERLTEVLSAADLHLIPLRRGLASASVPSKTYSILAAARPFVASVDEGTEVARLADRTGAGVAVPPDDAEALTKAIRRLLDDPREMEAMGERGRLFVEGWASPAAVAAAYEELIEELRR